MQKNDKAKREPLFHIVKRSGISAKQSIMIRAIAIAAALVIAGIISFLITKKSPLAIKRQTRPLLPFPNHNQYPH